MSLDILIWILAAIGTYISLVWIIAYLREKKYIEQEHRQLKNPLMVSIAIPAYNEEDNIENAVNSLLNCDYPKDKLEIIVVNDGSIDNTERILQKYVRKKLIKLIDQPNRGKGAALNNALKHAKGELFGVMDADTIVEKDTIAKLVANFTPRNLGAIMSAIKPFKVKSVLEKFQKVEYLLAILARKVMDRMDTNYVTPGALSLYNKDILGKLGGFDEHNITEDLEIALRLRSHGHRIKASASAFTYTVVPKTLGKLFRQRIRWNRGFLQNIWRYRYMILNPKYKTLGLYQLTIALVATFILIPAGFAMVGYVSYKTLYSYYLYFNAVGFTPPEIISMPTSAEAFLLSFNFKLYFPLAITVFLAFMLIVLAQKLTNESYKNVLLSILAIAIYYPFLGLIWLATLLFEILRIKRKW
ncbi:MAG: glycosyltransferase family 2 protein [Candidatus Aenigmarchaeota archaeon]|nr:glycosyltransferase family 2 protein [Candidatus Aenigmarchaeota archaeon]